jgi:hypothetical protein
MLEVTSAAFPADGAIPSKYTCDGEGISPPLAWAGVPDNARSLAILLLLSLPTGLPWHIAWHVVLLVGGAATTLSLCARDDDDP